jgi:hypothetical protein
MIEDAKVLLYLLAVEPAVTGMFRLIYEPLPTVAQLRDRTRNNEDSLLALRQQQASSAFQQDPAIADLFEKLLHDAVLDRARAAVEASIHSGPEGKAVVDASLAAGIVFLAHRCFELAGTALKNDGREIVPGYTFKDFLHQARNHAAHFSDPNPRSPLKTFQKTVLNYDPPPAGPFENRSAQCLALLGWKSWNEVHNDMRSLLL